MPRPLGIIGPSIYGGHNAGQLAQATDALLMLDAARGVFSDDAATIPITDGDDVAAWIDQVNSATFTDSGTAQKWRQSGPSVDNDGASGNAVHTYGGSLGAHTTLHLLVSLTINSAPLANTQIFRSTHLTTRIVYLNQSGNMALYDGTAFRDSGEAAQLGRQLLEVQIDGGAGAARFYRDGAAVGSSMTYVAADWMGAAIQLGSGSGAAHDVEFHKVLACGSILPPEELAIIRNLMQ